ncbi:hypothetical protein SAMN05880558_101186 [Aeromonas sp. RU39B]|nr:hypothetical protein SAMN05880558_101186 [Aeromonas sp. RU39B]
MAIRQTGVSSLKQRHDGEKVNWWSTKHIYLGDLNHIKK